MTSWLRYAIDVLERGKLPCDVVVEGVSSVLGFQVSVPELRQCFGNHLVSCSAPSIVHSHYVLLSISNFVKFVVRRIIARVGA